MTTNEYKAVRNEMGKDAGKALATFFIGLPLTVLAIVLFIGFPVQMSFVALAAAGILYAVKKARA